MDRKRKALGIFAVILITVALVNSMPIEPNAMGQGGLPAELTGQVHDHGMDIDVDGLLDNLVVDIEVFANTPGNYWLEVDGLKGYSYYGEIQIPSQKSIQTHLDAGLQNASVSFSAVLIYAQKLNVTKIWGIHLYDENHGYLDYVSEAALSKTYAFDDFDIGAILTTNLSSQGIDTDSDGLFNYLRISVEVNVSDTGTYFVSTSGLVSQTGQYVDVSNSTDKLLYPGTQIVDVFLPGSRIYSSRLLNISRVDFINLGFVEEYHRFQLEYKNSIPLSTVFDYSQFNTDGYFTGKINDQGIDDDSDGKFDYLEIGLEINITKSGDYRVELDYLVDNSSGTSSSYLHLFTSIQLHLDPGPILANFTIYGPQIYGASFNPELVGVADLYSYPSFENLDTLHDWPLPTPYDYTQFESHAVFTGNIVDEAVDADSDGLYDYLAVGIEINVMESGSYRVQCSGLADEMHRALFVSQYRDDSFTVGVHTVYLNYSGAMLAYNNFSPANLTYVYLFELDTNTQLEYVPEMALPTIYNSSSFNAPLEDMSVKLTVYPNATMGIDGIYNYTHMYPTPTMPRVNATLGISTNQGVTTASANGTVEVPSYVWPPEWPFNATTAVGISKLQGGLLNATLSASVMMPTDGGTIYPTNASNFMLNASYAGGLLNLDLSAITEVPPGLWTDPTFASEFPFNMSDVTVLANYDRNEIVGNMTFYTVSSFPLSNVIVFFKGNRTNLSLGGNLTVIYGDYYGNTINSTTIEGMLTQLNDTFVGPTGMIYNATDGLLQGTQISTLKEPLISNSTEYGAFIGYSATIEGNFTRLLAKILASQMNPHNPEENYGFAYATLDSAFSSVQHGSLELDFWHTTGTASIDLHLTSDVRILWDRAVELVPPTVPPSAPLGLRQQLEAWLKITNATAYKVQDFSLNASYSSSDQRLDLKASVLLTAEELKNDVIPYLPEAVYTYTVPEMQNIIRSFVNTTYCNVTSFDSIFTYADGRGSFSLWATLEGEFRLQTNHVRRFGLDYINATAGGQIPSYMRLLNMTNVDISNFKAELTMGKESMMVSFTGLITQPIKDDVDSVRFKFSRFLNAAYDNMEPPQQFQKLKITVVGGSNSTHVVLLYASPYVPPVHETSLNQTVMTWQSSRLSSLWDLCFDMAYLGKVDYAATTFYVPVFTNSSVTEFRFDPNQRSILFNVTAPSGAGFSQVTIPRSLVNSATLDEWKVYLDGRLLNSTEFGISDNAEYVFVSLNYTHSEHLVQIAGTWIVPEYQLPTMQILLATLGVMIALIAFHKRRKLARFNNVNHATLGTLMKRLSEFAT